MKLLNIVARKADNAPVLAADAVLACELKNNSLTHGQHSAGEIARPYDGRERSVGSHGHQTIQSPVGALGPAKAT
jgi:hypothetical protein